MDRDRLTESHSAVCDPDHPHLPATCTELAGREGGIVRLGEDGYGDHHRTREPGVSPRPWRRRNQGASSQRFPAWNLHKYAESISVKSCAFSGVSTEKSEIGLYDQLPFNGRIVSSVSS